MSSLSQLLAPVRAHLAASLWAFDFDGTLAPIVARPQDARPAPGAVEALVALAPRVRRLAVITGRPALTVVELGGLERVPGLVVLGHYGLQRWDNGVLSTPAPAPGVSVVRTKLPALLPPGATIEDKEHSVVVHTRQAADAAGGLAALEQPVRQLAAEHGLEVVPGRFVWELRPPGVDKGAALRSLVAQAEPAHVVVAGDDLGDLPMFTAAASLPVPAVRIAVVTAGSAPEVAAAADVTVSSPSALVAALHAVVALDQQEPLDL